MGSHPSARAYLALASVSFFWGTTYLGIRVALETIPPLALVPLRFCISGSIMLLAARLLGQTFPTRKEWLWSMFHGVMMLGVGNMCLSVAETLIPSSFAALILAASPFWLIGIEAAMPGGERLRAPTVAGLLLGVGGVALLLAPNMLNGDLSGNLWQGFLILQLGGASWSFGAILQRRHESRANHLVNAAFQQMGAGLVYVLPALVLPHREVVWTAKGMAALAYLVVFGSIVGYSSYIYALNHLPVALVSVSNYINVIVAAVLGWLFYREPFGWSEIASMLIIFVGVAVVKRFSSPSRAPSPPAVLQSSEAP